MSYNNSNVVECPAIQEELNNVFSKVQDKTLKREATQLTDFLMSDTNRSDFLQGGVTRNGKVYNVEGVWSPRYLPDNVRDNAIANCTGGATIGDFVQTYTIDPEVGSGWTISLTTKDFQRSCKPLTQWISEHVQKAINAVVWDINRKNWASVALNVGHFASAGNESAVSLNTSTLNSSGAYVHDLLEDVQFEAMEAGFGSVPYVFGGGLAYKYMKALAAGCCANALHIDLGLYESQNQFPFFFEREIDSLVGSNSLVALEAGAVQMLTYNEFVAPEMMEIRDQAFSQGTITDPFSGITFDLLMNYTCPGQWTIDIKVAHTLAYLPDGLYESGDRLNGTNGILEFAIVNP